MQEFFLRLWMRFEEWRFERKCIKYFGAKPEKIYLSQEDYDSLVKKINEPPDKVAIENLRKLLSRKAPWNN